MNDTQLSALRREPSPEFAGRLKERLDAAGVPIAAKRARWPLAGIAASIVVVAATGALFTVPTVRASARSLLAKFRVVNFVVVEVGESRVSELRATELDLPDLVGRHVQILQEPTPPVPAVSPEQAGDVAGIDVRLPAWLPPQVERKAIDVTGPGLLRVRADTARLQQLMDFLGIDDLDVPHGLNGKVADIRIPSIVRIQYEVTCEDCARAEFIQAKSPEITLPDGVDIAALGEIGLRILGVSAAEARQFARTIDWGSTVLVPVPWGASSFRQVNIDGHPGIAIEREIEVENSGDRPGAAAMVSGRGEKVRSVRYERVLLWSADGVVFGMKGDFRTESLLRMAHSVR